MPTPLFEIEARDIENLRRLYRKAPGKFRFAVASMLNNFAFGTRTISISIIKNQMEVRNERFVASRVRVDKASGREKINNQVATVGSIQTDRFTGWEEQEFGKPAKRTRVATLFARGDDESKQIKPSLRMKAANQFFTTANVPGKTEDQRNVALLRVMRREKKVFKIRKHRKLKKGIYKFKGQELKRVQNLEISSRSKRVKRVPWLSGGRRRYFKKTNIRNLWGKTLKRVLKFK